MLASGMTVWISRAIRSGGRLLTSPSARANALHEWSRQLGGEPALLAAPIRSVLVLCHGNICRSPLAAALLLRRRPDLDVASAGLSAGDGAQADPLAIRVANDLGVDLTGHRSRPVTPGLVAGADLVLVMEASHARALRSYAPDAAPRTRLLGDFLDTGPFRIPDPWGLPREVFAATFARIDDAVGRLAARLDAPAR